MNSFFIPTFHKHKELDIMKISLEKLHEFGGVVLNLAANGMTELGLCLNEAIYQAKLCMDLQNTIFMGEEIRCKKEQVIPIKVMNIKNGEQEQLGNGHFFRLDVEFINSNLKGGILELKSMTTATSIKQEYQLRNYLNQREDLCWGMVVNYISEFSKKNGPRVEVTIFMKTGQYSMFNNIALTKFFPVKVISKRTYPDEEELFVKE